MELFDRVLERAFRILGMLLLLFVVVLVITRGFGVVWTANWDIWVVATAVGTVGATVIALWLAARGIHRERDQVARVTSVWITDEYLQREDAPAYQRRVVLHLANESNEPVFDVRVHVSVGEPELKLGPLTVPPRIEVLPPRRELTYDITIPLRAHQDTWSPRAELYFTDPLGRRWLRTASGALREVSGQPATWSVSTEGYDERQFGLQDSLENPMLIAVSFLNGLRDSQVSLEELSVALAPEASGWQAINLPELRKMLDGYQPTSMVDYATSNIARVKLVNAPQLEGRVVEGESLALEDVIFMTLTRSASNGWRIFSIGGTNRPEEIPLPADAFD